MNGKVFHILAAMVLASLVLLSDPGCGKPSWTPPPPDFPPSGRDVTYTLMSYNVGGFKKYYDELQDYSYSEVAGIIQSTGAQVVGLNETDWNASRSDNQQQAKELSAVLGPEWQARFFMAGYSWYGNSMVWNGTDLEVVKEYPRLILPKNLGSEVRSMGAVEFKDFVFCVTHLDHVSEEDRQTAIARINNWASENYGDGGKPVFLVGDMNAEPGSETINKYLASWRQLSTDEYTFSTRNLRKCIDFIFVYKNGAEDAVEVLGGGVITPARKASVQVASDHCPYWVKVRWKTDL